VRESKSGCHFVMRDPTFERTAHPSSSAPKSTASQRRSITSYLPTSTLGCPADKLCGLVHIAEMPICIKSYEVGVPQPEDNMHYSYKM
jgi:hypothetical protein